MKTIGIVLIFSAFLVGAFLSSLDPLVMNWNLMVPVLLVGAVGLFMHRKAAHSEASSSDKVFGNMKVLEDSLNNIVANIGPLNAGKEELPVYEARFEIDRKFRDDLTNFANARKSMIHVFGIQNYADVMSNFAAGERYINRVWSASTDGYIDEVKTYLGRANEQFIEAKTHFDELLEEHAETTAQTVS